ncbi:MAG TPA: hypothetical protein VFF17_10940 [Thermoanaerobaculia bacterium]|nr:hypothetical protein [Thermoanaerobaculia bacterium]
MKKTEPKSPAGNRLSRAFAAAVLTAGLVSPGTLRADCLVTYADCVDAASEGSTFWRRSAAGLRCYTEFLSCLQRRLA